MPILNLSKDNFHNILQIHAVMLYPTNECARIEFITASLCGLKKNWDENIQLPIGALSYLLSLPSVEDVVKRAANDAEKAILAGDILDFIAQMHFAGYKEPSVNKAIYLIQGYLSTPARGYGKRTGSSEMTIRNSWEKYKSVAHLWAAFRVYQLAPKNKFTNIVKMLAGVKLDEFLAVAEHFRLFGESFKPSRIKTHGSILPKEETWRLPEDFALAEVNLNFGKLSTWTTNRLKTFKKI